MVGPLWDKVSQDAKELIRNLMAFDPGARLTVVQVRFFLTVSSEMMYSLKCYGGNEVISEYL